MSAATTVQAYERLKDALGRFGRFRLRWRRLHGLGHFILSVPGMLLGWVLLDAAAGLPAWPLLITFVLALGWSAWKTIALLAPLVRMRMDLESEARAAERLHGSLDNRLIGSLQLGRDLAAGSGHPDTRRFVERLVDHAAAGLESVHLEGLLDLRDARRALGLALAVALAWAALAFGAPQVLQQRMVRLHDAYAVAWETLFPVELEVLPGDIAVVRGSAVRLELSVRGAMRREAGITLEDAASGERQTHALTLVDGRVTFVVENAQAAFRYVFGYGERTASSFEVKVGDLPVVQAIHFEITPPSYTGAPNYTLTGLVPKLAGLPGTEVLVSFKANTNLHGERSQIVWQDGTRQALQISGRFGHFTFRMQEPGRVAIHLTGEYGKGFEMPHPVAFDIELLSDRPPSARIELKQKKILLLADQAAAFGFGWKAEDDFGVTEVRLSYKIDTVDEFLDRKPREGSATRVIDPVRDRVQGVFKDIFKELQPPLEPGDRVRLELFATDNNTETGPGVGRSEQIELVVVRPDLSGFVDKGFALGGLEGALGLEKLQRLERAKDLLVTPPKNVRNEPEMKVVRAELKAEGSAAAPPARHEDATSRYFDALSRAGQK